jgi:competence protein ComEC
VGRPFTGRLAASLVALPIVTILLAPSFAQRGAPLPSPDGLLRVAFLDVGQGDATLVRLPGGRALLVDAAGAPGSSFDAGERVVAPALRALGVRRIDTLVLTHGDPDHIGGAASVLRRFAPRSIWEGVPVPPNAALRELAALAAGRTAVWRTVQAGDVERIDGVDLRVWHPPPPDWERQRVRNDDSVVLELRHGDVSILLTGDIEREAERRLAPRLSLAPIVLLKAPHHGSATSSSEPFIQAARPRAVVFSAGRRNPFGHPHPTVVERYRALGVEIFRTDVDGAVVVDSDGRSATVRTYTGRRQSLSR